MGLVISKALEMLSSKQHTRILMLGLDAAGKTTVLYKLQLGDLVTSIPTIGFNVEKVQVCRRDPKHDSLPLLSEASPPD